jgi:2-deoxy-D-gluconate 3-dehydrogenase
MSLNIFSLEGKTALVTGASSGIGQAIAITLAESGAKVAVHSRKSGNAAETLATIEDRGGVAFEVVGDMADTSTPQSVFDQSVDQLGRVDILINNSGTIRRAPAIEYSEEDWQAVIDVNLTSVFRLSQIAGRAMIDNGGGKIVNIASLLSFQGGITVPAYTASKSAVAGLTKALANEWAKHNVNVNAIAPGYIATKKYGRTAGGRDEKPADTRAHSCGPLGKTRRPRRSRRVPLVGRERLSARPYSRRRRRLDGTLTERGHSCPHERQSREASRLQILMAIS